MKPRQASQRKKYSTSPILPASHGIDSKTIASTETNTIAGGMSRRYCLTKTSGSSGASPRTSSMAIELSMKPAVNVPRKTRLPRNLPNRYSPPRTVVEAITKPQRERCRAAIALEMT